MQVVERYPFWAALKKIKKSTKVGSGGVDEGGDKNTYSLTAIPRCGLYTKQGIYDACHIGPPWNKREQSDVAVPMP